jgi:hypothetical protein
MLNFSLQTSASSHLSGRLLAKGMALLVLLMFISACATKIEPGKVARDWSCKIREMQVNPIFPPREDVHVGDVYWLPDVGKSPKDGYCDKKPDFMPMPSHLFYLPEVNQLAYDHYMQRPNFPSMTQGTSSVSVTTSGIVITGGSQTTAPSISGSSLFANTSTAQFGTTTRTRLVGFPDFLTVEIDRASLGAILPIQGVFASIGISSEDVQSASISIPVAESYGVPQGLALATLTKSAHTTTICNIIKDNAEDAKNNPGARNEGGMHLVTEVFYTRAIDVNIQSNKAFALGLARDRENAGTTTTADLSLPSSTTGTSSTSSTAGMTQQQMAKVAADALKALNARNSTPGVTLSYESASSSMISMRRLFDRPVAIGFRSMELNPRKDQTDCKLTGAVVGSGIGPASTGTLTPARINIKQ